MNASSITMMSIPPAVEALIPRADMTVLDTEAYRMLGVAVLRQAISPATMRGWQEEWRQFREGTLGKGRDVNPFNPVVVKETLPPALAYMHRHPELLDVMEKVYPDLGIFGTRFVVKDAQSRTPVFVHQDYGYDLGYPEKTSVFLPLSPMSPENGGLYFYPGSHMAGYLGDVGEIDVDTLAPHWPTIGPSLMPGDIVLMHECTWHGSTPHTGGPDRIVAQLQYQPASDPSSLEVLRGRDTQLVRLTDDMRDKIFSRSRTSRLKEVQTELNALKARAN